MSNHCFFETFAQFIQPDFNRTESEGDFYNSPLRHLGVKNAYQVSPDIMRYKHSIDDVRYIYINLDGIAMLDEENKEHEKTKWNDFVVDFKNRDLAIFLSEALMQIYEKPAAKFRPTDFNFFDGVLAYFTPQQEDTESKKQQPKTGQHKANESLYEKLLDASLAVILFAYQRAGIEIPKKGLLTPEMFDLVDIDGNAISVGELVNFYNQYYMELMQDSKKKTVLANFLECKKDFYLKRDTAKNTSVRLIRRFNYLELSKNFKISFKQKPWNHLFHILRQGDDANFNKAGESFSFYEKHPSKSLLWDALMLLNLSEYLQSKPLLNVQDIMMDNMSGVKTGLASLKTNDLNAEPTLALDVRNKGRNPLASQDSRFYNPNAVISTEQNSTIQLPIFLYNGDDLEIESLEADDMEIPQRIKLRLEETLLDTVCGEFWLLKFGVFVYHGDIRTHIPSDMINEEIIDINGVSYVEFTIELDWMITKMVDLKLGRGIPSPLAGFTGEKGEGLIVIVFDMT